MCNVVRSCLVFLALALLQVQVESIAARRARRGGIGKVKVDTTAREYMVQVGAVIANKDGTPKDLKSAPTSVYCFLDKGK